MYASPLASRFASRSPVLRSDSPLSDDQIHRLAPSIFAEAPHASRSQRYAYIPTATVLTELRKEGLQPFMVTQTRPRHEDRRAYPKHRTRLPHARDRTSVAVGKSGVVRVDTMG